MHVAEDKVGLLEALILFRSTFCWFTGLVSFIECFG
jgi:hypothetical protein